MDGGGGGVSAASMPGEYYVHNPISRYVGGFVSETIRNPFTARALEIRRPDNAAIIFP